MSTMFKDKEDPKTGSDSALKILVDSSKTFQTVFGFGGAFTDSTGINLNALSEATRQKLLEAYFGENKCPLPAAISPLIPYLLKAWKLSKGELKLFASPWSAPGWMKSNGHMKGGGHLKGEFNGPYYQTYAKYFVRFLEEYWKKGVEFWGLTIQNEPGSGLDPFWNWQTMAFSSVQQRDFAHSLLSPALKGSPGGKEVKIMAHDDQRNGILVAAKDIYNDSAKAAAIDGLGVHWYSQSEFEALTQAHLLSPDKFILATEACTGYGYGPNEPLLGDWDRGQQYGYDILNNLKNWVIGWTDWNMALDLQGGPNWVSNFVDSPVIVNATADEFYKQPMFYFLGHFSKFVPRGSVRIDSQVSPAPCRSVEHVAFRTPNGNRVLVMINKHEKLTFNVTIEDSKMAGKSADINLQPKSINTVVWAKVSKYYCDVDIAVFSLRTRIHSQNNMGKQGGLGREARQQPLHQSRIELESLMSRTSRTSALSEPRAGTADSYTYTMITVEPNAVRQNYIKEEIDQRSGFIHVTKAAIITGFLLLFIGFYGWYRIWSFFFKCRNRSCTEKLPNGSTVTSLIDTESTLLISTIILFYEMCVVSMIVGVFLKRRLFLLPLILCTLLSCTQVTFRHCKLLAVWFRLC
uniref:Glucosylceramidase n=1 Tax=Ditylenchus dipsaci TaxID=166011 RepID=A0A915EC01_9BILA